MHEKFGNAMLSKRNIYIMITFLLTVANLISKVSPDVRKSLRQASFQLVESLMVFLL